MITPVDHKPRIFKTFQEKSRTKSFICDFRRSRRTVTEEQDAATKTLIAAGAVVGTILPMVLFAKHQNHGAIKKVKDIINIKYGLKEMIGISAGSIVGGVGAGLLFDKSTSKKKKLDEGVFQFFNASIPPLIFAGLSKICEKHKKLNNTFAKTMSVIVGVGAGMAIAVKSANFVNDPKDKVPDRKLTIKDSIVNIDDALGALVLAFPALEKFHIDKILPVIYSWCGYRAGESN